MIPLRRALLNQIAGSSPAMTTSAHILPTLARDVARVRRRVENILEAAARALFLAALDGPLAPFTAFAPARLRLGLLAGDHDLGVAHMLLHQPEQNGGVLRMQADAAMRGRAAEMRDLVAAVDGVAAVEEDRIGHRRPVVFAREPFALEPLRPVGAVRRAIAPARGRHRPFVAGRAVDRDRQALRRFVHGHHDAGLGARERAEQSGES